MNGTEATISKATERMAIRETIINGAKSRRIVTKNPNVQFHTMQEKHAWDKVIKLTGNVEKDFKMVVILLEENGILSEKYLLESEKFSHGKIIRTDYKMNINGHEVRAVFETYVETNQTFLKDAWVATQ